MNRVRIPIEALKNTSVFDEINGAAKKFDFVVLHPDDIRICMFKAKPNQSIWLVRIIHSHLGRIQSHGRSHRAATTHTGDTSMRVATNRLFVYYNQNRHIDEELDRALEKTLKKFGYHRDGSGIALESGVRDISFRKETSD